MLWEKWGIAPRDRRKSAPDVSESAEAKFTEGRPCWARDRHPGQLLPSPSNGRPAGSDIDTRPNPGLGEIWGKSEKTPVHRQDSHPYQPRPATLLNFP